MLSKCEFCNNEPIALVILDTYSVPKDKQMIYYVGIECMKMAIKRKLKDSYYQYAPYWLALRKKQIGKIKKVCFGHNCQKVFYCNGECESYYGNKDIANSYYPNCYCPECAKKELKQNPTFYAKPIRKICPRFKTI